MKIHIIILIILPFFLLGMLCLENTLEDLRWKKNVIMLFPDSTAFDMALTEDLNLKMEPRDLAYFLFSDSLYSNTGFRFSEEYIGKLKARYLLGSKSACWVLLGKDGSLKMRREEDLDWGRIFAAVDSIPVSNGEFIWE